MADTIKLQDPETGEIIEVSSDKVEPMLHDNKFSMGDVGRALLSGANSAVFSLGDNALDLISKDYGDSVRNQIDSYRQEYPYGSMATDAISSIGTGGLLAKGAISGAKMLPRAYKYIKPVAEGTGLTSQIARAMTGATLSTAGEANNVEDFADNLPSALVISGMLPIASKGITSAMAARAPSNVASEDLEFVVNSLHKSGYQPEDINKASKQIAEAFQMGKPLNVVEALQGDIGIAAPLRETALLRDFKNIQRGSNKARQDVIEHYSNKLGTHLQKRITKDLDNIYDTEAVLNKFIDEFDDNSFVSKNIIEAAEKAASLELSPIYKEAFEAAPELPESIVEKIAMFKEEVPEFKKAYNQVVSYYKVNGNEDLISDTSTKFIHDVNSQMKTIIRKAEKSNREVLASDRSIKQVKNTIQSLMPDEVKNVDKAYAEITSKTNVRKSLQKTVSKTRDEGYASISNAIMGNEDKRQQIQNVTTPEAYEQIAKALSLENLMQKTGALIEGGSDTSTNQASKGGISQFFSKVPYLGNLNEFLKPDNTDMYNNITNSLLKTGEEGQAQLNSYADEIARILRNEQLTNTTTNILERGYRGGGKDN